MSYLSGYQKFTFLKKLMVLIIEGNSNSLLVHFKIYLDFEKYWSFRGSHMDIKRDFIIISFIKDHKIGD